MKKQLRTLIAVLATSILFALVIMPTVPAQSLPKSSTDFIRESRTGLVSGQTADTRQRVVTQDFINKCAQAADEIEASRQAIKAFAEERETAGKILNLTRELAELRKEQQSALAGENAALREAFGARTSEVALLKTELDAARRKRRGNPALTVLKIVAGIFIGKL